MLIKNNGIFFFKATVKDIVCRINSWLCREEARGGSLFREQPHANLHFLMKSGTTDSEEFNIQQLKSKSTQQPVFFPYFPELPSQVVCK